MRLSLQKSTRTKRRFNIKGTCTILDPETGLKCHVQMIDISSTGLAFNCHAYLFPIDSTIEVSLVVKDQPFTCFARVVDVKIVEQGRFIFHRYCLQLIKPLSQDFVDDVLSSFAHYADKDSTIQGSDYITKVLSKAL